MSNFTKYEFSCNIEKAFLVSQGTELWNCGPDSCFLLEDSLASSPPTWNLPLSHLGPSGFQNGKYSLKKQNNFVFKPRILDQLEVPVLKLLCSVISVIGAALWTFWFLQQILKGKVVSNTFSSCKIFSISQFWGPWGKTTPKPSSPSQVVTIPLFLSGTRNIYPWLCASVWHCLPQWFFGPDPGSFVVPKVPILVVTMNFERLPRQNWNCWLKCCSWRML